MKCLDSEQLLSQSCDPDVRPDLRRTCNHRTCASASSAPRDSDVTGRTGGGGGRRHQHASGDEGVGGPRNHHSSQGTVQQESHYPSIVSLILFDYSFQLF